MAPNIGALLGDIPTSRMNTKGRRKPTGAAPVPENQDSDSPPTVLAARTTRGAKAKVPAVRKTKIDATTAKKRAPPKKKPTRVPRMDAIVESEEESDSSQILEDPESLNVESEPKEDCQLKIELLRRQLAELEANQQSRNPLKRNPSRMGSDLGARPELSPPDRRSSPAEGRSLGTFNGKTDLDTFLVRFETCSRHFGWSRSERVFHLMNALTESAEPIVKEVGPTGTLELILEMLQNRFGNRLRRETFHADIRNRKRGRGESLQDLYLDLCRLRALASGEGSDDKFPEKYFRNIFVDALNDRDFRKALLVKNPGTMEEAYRVATQLEAIDAYNTPVTDTSRMKPRVRQIDYGIEDTAGSNQKEDSDENLARRIVELENEVQSLRAGAQRQDSYFPNVPPNRQVRPPVQNPRPMSASDQLRGGGPVSSTHEFNVPGNRELRGARPGQQNCFNCVKPGHFSRDCRKPRYQAYQPGRGTQFPQQNDTTDTRTGGPPGNLKGLTSPSKIRREAYLDVQMGGRNLLALLDSGCEQSVIGRNLFRKVPLEPTEKKLSTADGTDLPLLGETVIHFSIAVFSTSCRVVVTEAVTDLILGIEWLQKNQCVWDFGSNSFTIKGHRGRLKCRRTKRQLRRILVNEEVVIPGFHTTNVPVLVTRSSLGSADQSWGFTQKMRDNDLMIASAIYGSDNIQSVCQVMNMSDKPRRLNRGTELGWAEPVEVIGTEEEDQMKLKDEIVPLDLTQNRIRQIQNPSPTEVDPKESQLTRSRVVEESEPDFIQDMLNKMNVELSKEQEERVKQLLHENREVFSTSEFDLGRTNLVQHRIDTGVNRPFKQQLRRHPMAYLPVIDEHVDKMLANNICEPSSSPWASNVVLVKKSDGTLRFYIDYRQLNNLTVKDSYPLPRIDTCFDALGGAKYFSTLDLRQGYWQVENDPETADKTTFITRKGAFKFEWVAVCIVQRSCCLSTTDESGDARAHMGSLFGFPGRHHRPIRQRSNSIWNDWRPSSNDFDGQI